MIYIVYLLEYSCQVATNERIFMIHFLNYSFSKSNKQKMNRIKEEQRVVEQMIRLYCRKMEGNKELCPSCKELLQYATARLGRCKFGENKPTCKKCPILCI